MSHFLIGKAAFLVLTCSLSLAGPASAEGELITVREAVTQPRLPADFRFNYGPRAFQFGELWLPKGSGPFSIAVVIHGGCWQDRFDLHLMDAMSESIAATGVAVWNVEYRRSGNRSAGWPATFEDIQLATRFVGNLATRFALDLNNVLVIGHSSGGHLALWLARYWRKGDGTLDPAVFNLKGVVAVAPVTDLVAAHEQDDLGCHSSVARFMGGSLEALPQRYHSASPMQFGATRVPYSLVSGTRDPIVASAQIERYHAHAKERGDAVGHRRVDGAGHFELITPGTEAWPEILAAIRGFTESAD